MIKNIDKCDKNQINSKTFSKACLGHMMYMFLT